MSSRPSAQRSPTASDLIGVSEAARLLGVTRQTVYRRAARGDLVAQSLDPPRFLRGDVERLTRSPAPGVPGNSARTRERILLAAARVIAESGIAACTMEAVASESGVSRGGVLHHFVDKDQLMTALAQAFTEAVDAEWNQLLADDATLDVADAYIAMTTSPPHPYGAAVLLGATAHEVARAHVADAVRRWYSRIDDESADGAAVERCLAADALWLLATLRADPLPPAVRNSLLARLAHRPLTDRQSST
jgi:AcrR family transcriptional regulator